MSSQRGFARESVGEPSTFKLWHTGHNNGSDQVTLSNYLCSPKFASFLANFANNKLLDTNLMCQLVFHLKLEKFTENRLLRLDF